MDNSYRLAVAQHGLAQACSGEVLKLEPLSHPSVAPTGS